MRAVIFGGSGIEEHEQDYKDAYEAGRLLAEKGFTVVNGGYKGIMEAVSKGAHSVGGKAVGVACKLFTYEQPNKWLSEVIETDDLFERTKTCFKDSKLIIVFPGASGTLMELMFAHDLISMGMIEKQPIILFGDYWKPVLDHVFQKAHHLKKEGTIKILKDINELKEFLEKWQSR